MNLSRKITNVITSLIIFSLVLLPNNIYSMQNQEKTPKEVIIGGDLVQIEMETNKVMVYGINDGNKLKNHDLIKTISGDVIVKIYDKYKVNVNNRSEIINILLNMDKDDNINLEISRNNKILNIQLNKSELNHAYLTDKIPYCASLTYIDKDKKEFGAVAHSLETKETKNILKKSGNIYLANIDTLQKSKKKFIGNIVSNKINDKQGDIIAFSNYGIKGKICSEEILKNKEIYKVAEPQEITNGVAYLVIKHNTEKEKKFYEIEITKTNNQTIKTTNNFEFTIKDKRLIKEYGGIVQGMSGCPIVQNGKIVGALSHVKTDNTRNGVGLYIKWMMED